MALRVKPLLPIRCLVSDDFWPDPDPADALPPEPPVRDVVVNPRLTVVHKPHHLPRLAHIVYEDTLLMEAKVVLWVRLGEPVTHWNGREVNSGATGGLIETFVPLAWIEAR